MLLVSGCGSDTRQVIGTTPSTTATSVPTAPASTTPTVAGTTPAPTTAAPAPTTPVTAAATTTTAKRPVATTSTTARAATTTAPTATTGTAIKEYAPAPAPTVPGKTHPVPADNSHPNGVYYATVAVSGDPPPAAGSVVFEIVQLFRGADCAAHFGTANPDACVNDYGVETDPTQTIEVPLKGQSITVVDAATQRGYTVSGPELYKLIQGAAPSAQAPQDYAYAGFGYLVTVSGGKVTRLEQWWTP